MTKYVARMGFLPYHVYGRGAGAARDRGEGATIHSALSPTLSHKWERGQPVHRRRSV